MALDLDTPTTEARLEEAILCWLRAVDAGETPNPDRFVADFPGLEAELSEFIAEQCRFTPLAPLRLFVADTPGLAAGQRVGAYELLDELGRGGMGVVYRARQEGINRTVALKMILAGPHAAPENLARFRAEAAALARLQHPHVVQVHEVGEHDGLPYFTMEFCSGGALDRRLAGTPLPPRRAAELAETLAQAVQAAHARGIVHRDLKPANILLQRKPSADYADSTDKKARGSALSLESVPSAESVDDFFPKITDFGLAKTLDGASGQTRSGVIVGTPSYMAPEQAGGKSREVGAAADIYSLGAVLYELLTGRPPFRAATHVDTILQVLNDEPVPPCRLQPKLPRDLETICLKCLEKEPGKRYPSAAALADDLGRFREGVPVLARPVSAPQRLWRWAKRNRAIAGLLAAVAALLLGIVIALAVSSLLLHQEQKATLAQKQQAELNLVLAQKAVEEFLIQVTENPRLEEADLNDLRKRLLESALPYFEEFVQQKAADPELEARRGRALYRLAKVRVILGENDQAQAAYQQMEDLFTALTRSHPESAAYRRDLARCYQGRGELLVILAERLRPEEAEAEFRRALVLEQRLTAEFPGTREYEQDLAGTHFSLGSVVLGMGRPIEAEQEFREALTILEHLATEFPAVADYRWQKAASLVQLGATYGSLGNAEAGVEQMRKALPLLNRLAAESPRAPRYRLEQARCHNLLSNVLRTLKQNREAIAEGEQARALYEGLARDFPSVVEYRQGTGRSWCMIGYAQKDANELTAALTSIRQGQTIIEQLAQAHPEVEDYRKQAADIRLSAGCVLILQGAYRQAAAEMSRSDDAFQLIPYNIACFWSLAYKAVSEDRSLPEGERQRLTEEYAGRALHWLAHAHAKGYFRPKGAIRWMKNDPDIIPLRGRADFQRFLSMLEAE